MINDLDSAFKVNDYSAKNSIDVKKITDKDVAIIGVSARMPMANDVNEFWNLLLNGVDCIKSFPEQRRKDVENYLKFTNKDVNSIKFEDAAYFDRIDCFDYKFFKLSPKEAKLLDPSQRLFLETTWEAIEDAGYAGKRIKGTRTGIYLGYSSDDQYKNIISDVEPSSLPIAVPGNLSPFIASRIAYLLDLKGPSMVVNTLCSSSLVALHLACNALKNGECEMAIAGGVQLYPLPIRSMTIGIESVDRKTRAFDYDADGFGGGEAVIAVILKPLSKAIKDKDNIYAVIKGSAVNQDGASNGLTAPNPIAQSDVLIRAWEDAGVKPEEISYIETHGTATRLGDPIEIEGINGAFRRFTNKKQFCAVGTVKANIGHTDASAGLAGLLKVILALKNKKIPPLLKFKRPNKEIRFHKSAVYVNDVLTEWNSPFPRKGGVSSFGFSGTNCHVIVEESNKTSFTEDNNGSYAMTLSAKNEMALLRLVEKYAKYNLGEYNLKNICFVTNTGREHYSHRLCIIAKSTEELVNKLNQVYNSNLESNKEIGIYYGVHNATLNVGSSESNGAVTKDVIIELANNANKKIKEFISSNSNDEKILEQLCSLYVKGADIDWEAIYLREEVYKITLPTYSFEKDRCWIDIPEKEIKSECEYTDNLFYKNIWNVKKLDKNVKTNSSGTVVIFMDEVGIGKQISDRLRANNRQVIQVQIGSKYEKISDMQYIIGQHQGDYEEFINSTHNRNITQIIHISSIIMEQNTDSIQKLDYINERSVFSLLYITKALIENQTNDIDVVIISNNINKITGRETSINCENAPLLGLGKSINAEIHNVKCRSIDIDEHIDYDNILNEITIGYTDYLVSYREGQRYVEELAKIENNVVDKEMQFKGSGVYVITGGTGGIGLEIAKYMTSKNRINIALLSRTQMPSRESWESLIEECDDKELVEKIKDLVLIEKEATNLEVLSVDVCDQSRLEDSMKYLRDKYGSINGIIHSAGVGVGRQGDRINNISSDTFKKIMLPKVHGTWLLNNITQNDNMDFFIVFSSPITLIGGIGAGSYTAANYYLESFVSYRNMFNKKTIAISWAPWEKTIKSLDTKFSQEKQIFNILSTPQLIKAFEQTISMDLEKVIVGELNYNCKLFSFKDLLPFKLSDKLWESINVMHKRKDISIMQSKQQHIVVEVGNGNKRELLPIELDVAHIFADVLGYKKIRLSDNFFELGGDSIIAMKLINLINNKMNIEVKMSDLVSNLTIEEFAGCLQNKYLNSKNESDKYLCIKKAPKKDYYEISKAQQRFYMLSQQIGIGITYNMPEALIIKGKLDRHRVENIFKKLIERHESLRTSFENREGQPVQIIHDEVVFNMNYKDIQEKYIKEEITRFIRPFQLNIAPLFRAELLKIGEDKHMLLMDLHHIISDGTSKSILINEFVKLYEGQDLESLSVQYKDYSLWQTGLLTSKAFKRQENYWMHTFSGKVPVLKLPLDYQRPIVQSFVGETIVFKADHSLAHALKNLGYETKATLNMVLLTAYYILLHKYSGDDDIIIGSVAAGRRHKEVENVIGVFLNFVAIRCRIDENKQLVEFLSEVKERVLRAFENQDYPLEQLVDKLSFKEESRVRHLYDTMFITQNVKIPKIKIENLEFIPYRLENSTSRLDISFDAEEIDEELEFRIEYCTDIFKKETVQEEFIKDYLKILNHMVNDKNMKIKDLRLKADFDIIEGICTDTSFDF